MRWFLHHKLSPTKTPLLPFLPRPQVDAAADRVLQLERELQQQGQKLGELEGRHEDAEHADDPTRRSRPDLAHVTMAEVLSGSMSGKRTSEPSGPAYRRYRAGPEGSDVPAKSTADPTSPTGVFASPIPKRVDSFFESLQKAEIDAEVERRKRQQRIALATEERERQYAERIRLEREAVEAEERRRKEATRALDEMVAADLASMAKIGIRNRKKRKVGMRTILLQGEGSLFREGESGAFEEEGSSPLQRGGEAHKIPLQPGPPPSGASGRRNEELDGRDYHTGGTRGRANSRRPSNSASARPEATTPMKRTEQSWVSAPARPRGHDRTVSRGSAQSSSTSGYSQQGGVSQQARSGLTSATLRIRAAQALLSEATSSDGASKRSALGAAGASMLSQAVGRPPGREPLSPNVSVPVSSFGLSSPIELRQNNNRFGETDRDGTTGYSTAARAATDQVVGLAVAGLDGYHTGMTGFTQAMTTGMTGMLTEGLLTEGHRSVAASPTAAAPPDEGNNFAHENESGAASSVRGDRKATPDLVNNLASYRGFTPDQFRRPGITNSPREAGLGSQQPTAVYRGAGRPEVPAGADSVYPPAEDSAGDPPSVPPTENLHAMKTTEIGGLAGSPHPSARGEQHGTTRGKNSPPARPEIRPDTREDETPHFTLPAHAHLHPHTSPPKTTQFRFPAPKSQKQMEEQGWLVLERLLFLVRKRYPICRSDISVFNYLLAAPETDLSQMDLESALVRFGYLGGEDGGSVGGERAGPRGAGLTSTDLRIHLRYLMQILDRERDGRIRAKNWVGCCARLREIREEEVLERERRGESSLGATAGADPSRKNAESGGAGSSPSSGGVRIAADDEEQEVRLFDSKEDAIRAALAAYGHVLDPPPVRMRSPEGFLCAGEQGAR